MRKLEAELKRKEKMAAVEIELEERVVDYNMDIEDEDFEEDHKDESIKKPKLTKKEESEAKMIVDWLLKERSGDKAELVMRYLKTHTIKKNFMPVPSTAAESLRYLLLGGTD